MSFVLANTFHETHPAPVSRDSPRQRVLSEVGRILESEGGRRNHTLRVIRRHPPQRRSIIFENRMRQNWVIKDGRLQKTGDGTIICDCFICHFYTAGFNASVPAACDGRGKGGGEATSRGCIIGLVRKDKIEEYRRVGYSHLDSHTWGSLARTRLPTCHSLVFSVQIKARRGSWICTM